MKRLTQWLNIFTDNSLNRRSDFNFIFGFGISGFCVLVLALAGCASHEASSPRESLPQQKASSSIDSYNQSISYIREHPSSREDERVQRFLFIDRWLKAFQDNNRLAPEQAREFWDDLTAQVKDEPGLSLKGLETLRSNSVTKLGRNVALYQTYQFYLKDESLEMALHSLEGIEEDGISDLYRRAQELLELKRTRVNTGARRIGVLLPLSGPFQSFGQEALQAIQMASQSAYSEGVEFLIEDTGSSNDQLAKAWNKLAVEQKVTAILGPLTAAETEFVFERAQVASVPVISLAPKESLKTFGNYGFRMTLTLEDQAKALAEFLSRQLDVKKIGILMPDSSYGWDAVDRAKKEFEGRGMEVTALQVYSSDATDFKEPLRKMARMDIPDLRKDEFCPPGKKKTEAAQMNCARKAGDLKPIIDFEALYIPDSAEKMGLLLPTLPYMRIYGVQVIGLSGYNSNRLFERAGESAEGVVFTDSYLPSSDDFQVRYFRDQYLKLAKKEPTRTAAEAYDLAMISIGLMKRGDNISPELFADRIRHLGTFPGVTGNIYYENQLLKKQPKLLIARDGEFHELK